MAYSIASFETRGKALRFGADFEKRVGVFLLVVVSPWQLGNSSFHVDILACLACVKDLPQNQDLQKNSVKFLLLERLFHIYYTTRKGSHFAAAAPIL